jgi:hypothetical protein
MYDLDESIPNEQGSIVVSFVSGLPDDGKATKQKGVFSSVETAMEAIDQINNEHFICNKQVDWLTSHTNVECSEKDFIPRVFSYDVSEQQFFLSVVVYNIRSESDLQRIHSQFKTFFELSDEEFKE